jgi:hypothetical protein
VGNEIDLGFEPQWLLYKSATSTIGWYVWDTMRGWSVNSSSTLQPNTTSAESITNDESAGFPQITNTGFKVGTNNFTGDNQTYIYMAIRRPHKPPTVGTEVFATTRGTTDAYATLYTSGFPADLVFQKSVGGGGFGTYTWSRLAGSQNYMDFTSNQLENGGRDTVMDSNTQFSGFGGLGSADGDLSFFAFKRAPGFFDVVAYTGTGSATTINHNLGAVPSVVLIKGRNTTYNWYWQHYALGANTWMQLNNQEAGAGNGNIFNSTLPTSSVFSVGSLAGTNESANTYIAYLFGDLPGISKAGTYTGTGSNINVNCGFTAGARFVLIKRKDGSGNVGDWYFWDSVRGIVSGNDPYLLINTTGAEVTNTDYIDPLSSGFTVTSSAPAALNLTGGTYIFLAIA